MSALGLAFLILTALALYHFDRSPEGTGRGVVLGWVFLTLWLPLFVDALTGFWREGDFSWASARRLLLLSLIPPYRIALSPHPAWPCIWLPWLGWQVADHDLFERLERFFSVPMLFIAVLILPVLAGEFIWTEAIAASATLRLALDLGTALIWVAFCVEFIVMSRVAPNKLGYIARNWINLAVILLPFLAFLRGVLALRLVWFAKLGTTLKVYRMRGLGMRAWRGLVALDLLERLSHRTPQARLAHLRGILREKEREVARLRRRIHHLELEHGDSAPAPDPAPQDPPPGPPPQV
jgi:voltage-gated potassium channel